MGAAFSNVKWLAFNNLEEMKKEMDDLVVKMDRNLDERRKLNESRNALSKDLQSIRTSSIMNAEILQTTKDTISHNVNDVWTEVQQMSERQNTMQQLMDLQVSSIKEELKRTRQQAGLEKKDGKVKALLKTIKH